MEHAELPGPNGCNGLQLWVNLPRAEKDVESSFQDAASDDLPIRETAGATVTTVVGEGSPLELRTPVEYRVVSVTDGWEWTVPDGWNGFLFVVSGTGRVARTTAEAAEFVVVSDGGSLSVSTGSRIRVACVAGKPHGEQIQQRGPFVA